MNRRNFFQSILAGIGALVGYRYMPEAKPRIIKPFVGEEVEYNIGVDIDYYEDDIWYVTSVYEKNKGEFIQYRHKRYGDDEIIIDWIRCVMLNEKSTDATDKTTDRSV